MACLQAAFSVRSAFPPVGLLPNPRSGEGWRISQKFRSQSHPFIRRERIPPLGTLWDFVLCVAVVHKDRPTTRSNSVFPMLFSNGTENV